MSLDSLTRTQKRKLRRKIKDQIDVDSQGCWVWQGWVINTGYSQMSIPRSWGVPTKQLGHRVAYRVFRGRLGKLLVNHVCGNRICLNPNHLGLATPRENVSYRTVMNKNNTSGYRGVVFIRGRNKPWRACLKVNRKSKTLGYYHTAQEADAACREARALHHNVPEFEDRKGNSA